MKIAISALSGQRIWRGIGVFGKSLEDAKGLKNKWAMWRCIVGHTRARLGWPGEPREVTISVGHFQMTLDIYAAEIVPYWEMWYEGEYEALPQFCPGEDACVVDVGGNVGFYMIRQAMRLRTGRVVVFEPSPAVFRRLQRNVESNKLTNITLINAAVGSSSGTVHFIERARSINSRVVEAKTDETLDIPCTTLDAELGRLTISRVDILKIDAEGAEKAVLSGATGILPGVSRVVMELHKNADEEMRSISGMLRSAGLYEAGHYGTVIYYIR